MTNIATVLLAVAATAVAAGFILIFGLIAGGFYFDWKLRKGQPSMSADADKPKLSEWFFVEFDEQRVVLRASPPGQEAWEQAFPWASIIRVCYQDEGPGMCDGIYVYTTLRPESYVVPAEAAGGDKFFGAIVGRGLFPREVMLEAMTSVDGGLYCWPPPEPGTSAEIPDKDGGAS